MDSFVRAQSLRPSIEFWGNSDTLFLQSCPSQSLVLWHGVLQNILSLFHFVLKRAKFKIMPKKLLRDFEPLTLEILIFFGPMFDDTCMSDFRSLTSPRMPQKSYRKEGALNTWDCPTDYCYLITHKGQFAFGENVASVRRYRVPGYKTASSSMWSPWV